MRDAAKKKWTMKTTNPKGEAHHWFATSIAEWHVSDSLDALIARMKRERHDFQIWRIDLPLDAAYQIANYTPVVEREKMHLVGYWRYSTA